MTTTSGPTITGTSVHGQEDFEPELGVAVSDASGTPETVYYLVRSAGSSTWNVTNGHTETGSAGDEILYKVEPGKLLPGKTYEWSARACNGSTCSGYTAVSSWTVDPTLGAGERRYFSFKSFQLTDRMTAKVNLGTGNLLVEMNDLAVPGVTSDLPVGQTYNSLALAPGSHNASGVMGLGWSFSLPPDLGLAIHLDNTVTFWDATGTPVWFFHPTQVYVTNYWDTPSGADESLTQSLDGVYHVKVHSSGVEYLFDSSGRLTGINDRSGNTFQITRDASNNVTGVIGTRGGATVGAPGVTNTARKISITGPSAGQLISQLKQSPNDGSPLPARTVQFTYTGSLLKTVTDAAGRVTTFGYDSNNRLSQITSPPGDGTTGNITNIIYQANDANGNPDYRVKKVSQVLDATTTLDNLFEVDDTARTNKFTDGAGRFTTYALDATSGQDRNGRIGKVTDAWGLQVGSTGWSPDSQITGFTNSSGGASSVEYNANNGESPTKLSIDSGAGSGNSMTLGGYGASGSSTQYSPGNGTSAGGNTSSYRYDGAGNLQDNRDAAGNTAIVQRNSNGTVKFTTTPNNIGDGSSHGSACQRTDSHTTATVTDNCSLYSYDSTSVQLTSITPPDNAGSLGTQQFSYDGFGRRASVTDGRGVTLTYSYDALDRLTKVHPSDTTPDVIYTYDRDGNLATRADANATMTYTYDRVNRLSVQSSNGTVVCPGTPDNVTQCFGYDKAGNLRSLADGRGTTTYHYNDVSELDEMNEATGKTDVFGYDSDHRRTDTYTATGNAVDTVTYNPDHTLSAPTSWASHTHNNLDHGGRLTNTTTTRGGASVNVAVANLDYSYNVPPGAAHGCYPSGGSSDGSSVVTAGGDVAANNDYGKRTTRKDNLTGVITTYCYDASGRLISASDSTASYTYSYDADGNRTGETVNGVAGVIHHYNAADQITDTGFSYDAAGNQTTGPDVTTPAANINAYQQTGTMTPAGGTSTTFKYGGTSQTELRSKSGGFTYINGPTGIMSQTLSGGGILYFERDPSGTLISDVWINSSGALAGEYYYYFDGTGSVIGLIQGNGTWRAAYTYDPYGGHDTATPKNGTTLPTNPYRYAGGLAVFTNSNNGALLYKFGQRYYQPDLGRWTQPDSIDHSSDPSQADPYTYASGDPINSVDPSGAGTFGISLSGCFVACVSFSIGTDGISSSYGGLGSFGVDVTGYYSPEDIIYSEEPSVSTCVGAGEEFYAAGCIDQSSYTPIIYAGIGGGYEIGQFTTFGANW